jgi:HK97 family phage major capsid protein
MRFADELRTQTIALKDERARLTSELNSLDKQGLPPAAIEARATEIADRATEIAEELERKQERIAELDALDAERSAAPRLTVSGDVRGGTRSADEERAHRTVGDAFGRGWIPAHAAERATALLTEGRSAERSIAARWVNAAGDPAYATAFAKLAADPTRGHLMWDATEAEAYRQVVTVQAEMEGRAAMSLTGANGGYMVPLSLDPSIIITNDGHINPLRELASVKQTSTNTWQGVTSAGVTAEWKTEGSEVADASPTLGSPSIPVFLGDAFVQYSYEVGMDASNFLSELTGVLADGLANLHAVAFATGNGTTAPQGIVTGLAGTSSEINTTGTEAYDDSDPFVLQNALPARWSGNATFQGHIATMNQYRQMETTNGALLFPELRQNPPYLLGKRFYENSNMDGAINAAATANNYVLIYGDVRSGYYIVDRIGTTLEFIPNMVGANNLPTGQRGAIMWARTGAEVVIAGALRLLDIPTTA